MSKTKNTDTLPQIIATHRIMKGFSNSKKKIIRNASTSFSIEIA